MAYTGIGFNEVQQYLKSCSNKRLEKIQMDIQGLLYERDDKKVSKHLKATHKKGKKNKDQLTFNFGGTD